MVVIYEVNLEIAGDVAAEFAEWLPHHVAEVLALPGFIDAVIASDEMAGADIKAWSVRYRLDNRQALDRYLDQHAERMRADGMTRFGGHMRASRRIMTEVRRLETSGPCKKTSTRD